jgi:hypothetical protein
MCKAGHPRAGRGGSGVSRPRARAFRVRFADDALLVFEREEDARPVLEVLAKCPARFGLTGWCNARRPRPGSVARCGRSGRGAAAIAIVRWRSTGRHAAARCVATTPSTGSPALVRKNPHRPGGLGRIYDQGRSNVNLVTPLLDIGTILLFPCISPESTTTLMCDADRPCCETQFA